MYSAVTPIGYMAQFGYGAPPAAGYGLPLAAGYGLPLATGYGLPPAAGYGLPPAAGYGLPLTAGYGLPLAFAEALDPEAALLADPPEAEVGVAPSGRCVALPNLRRGTVVTVREMEESVLIGIWSVTRLRTARDGRIALTVYLPATVILDKVSGRTRSRPANLTVTLRGANLQEVANAAAEAWCRAG